MDGKVEYTTISSALEGRSAELPLMDRSFPAPHGIFTLLVMAGSLLNGVVYESMDPLILGAMFLLGVWILLRLSRVIDENEQMAFMLSFSITWICSGIAAYYFHHLADPSQSPGSDAFHFYDLVSGDSVRGMSFKEISLMTEGAGAVVIWRIFYGLASSLGFTKGAYIGILINSILVSLTAIVCIKVAKVASGREGRHLGRVMICFAMCGIFWLFASIHTRDAAVLLPVSLLVLFWVRYLSTQTVAHLFQLIVATAAAFAIFGFLRTEFLFVPLAMLMAGLVASFSGTMSSASRNKAIGITFFIALPAALTLWKFMQSDLLIALMDGNNEYSGFANERAGSGSLGAQLIVNQPLLLRLAFGSAYLFVFPIPFWADALDSAYHLFKSCQALFMYAVAPLYLLCLLRIVQDKARRTPPILFLVYVSIGFTLSIAYTSLENRHFGAFMVPIIVLAGLPDISAGRDRAAYRILLTFFVGGMAAIHVLWGAIKLL